MNHNIRNSEESQASYIDLTPTQRAEINALLSDLAAGAIPPVEALQFVADYARFSPVINTIIPVLIRDWGLNDSDRLAINRVLARATNSRLVWRTPSATASDPEGRAIPQPAPEPGESQRDPEAPERETRIDPEIGRLAAALRRDSQLRLWAILRDAGAGRGGWLDRDQLYQKLGQRAKEYTRRHFNRLIAAGDGVFWQIWTEGRVGLVGAARVGAALVAEAFEVDPRLVATNKPGRLEMLIPLGDNLQQWRAHLYGAWLAMKQDPQIAREKLESLWAFSAESLRNWERENPRITISRNYGQVILDSDQDADHLMDHLPSDPSLKREFTWSGKILITWQMVNTYHASYTQCQGSTRAQARRKAASATQRPAPYCDRGQRWHYATAVAMRKACQRTGPRAGMIWRGENNRGYGIWELSTEGETLTGANSRAKGDRRKRFMADYWATLRNVKRKIQSGHYFDPLSCLKNDYAQSVKDGVVVAAPLGAGKGGRGGTNPQVDNSQRANQTAVDN